MIGDLIVWAVIAAACVIVTVLALKDDTWRLR